MQAKYRGEFEERLKDVLKQLKVKVKSFYASTNHTIVGAGKTEGAMDAGICLNQCLHAESFIASGQRR